MLRALIAGPAFLVSSKILSTEENLARLELAENVQNVPDLATSIQNQNLSLRLSIVIIMMPLFVRTVIHHQDTTQDVK